jgi:hypothetical protein
MVTSVGQEIGRDEGDRKKKRRKMKKKGVEARGVTRDKDGEKEEEGKRAQGSIQTSGAV